MPAPDKPAQGWLYAPPPAKPKPIVPAGYYHLPGTGPALESCATCAHAVRFRTGRVWLKCAKNARNWTPSRRTDILPSSPACRYWAAQPEIPAPPEREINRAHAIKRWKSTREDGA
jgi:hypothetical protein